MSTGLTAKAGDQRNEREHHEHFIYANNMIISRMTRIKILNGFLESRITDKCLLNYLHTYTNLSGTRGTMKEGEVK